MHCNVQYKAVKKFHLTSDSDSDLNEEIIVMYKSEYTYRDI